jgi:hypothetical protein
VTELREYRRIEYVDKAPVLSLSTLQMGRSLFDELVTGRWAYIAHLVRATERGTPGPMLCGIDRFGPDAPGWSLRGGVSGPNVTHPPCPGCVEVAARDYPGVPVDGMSGPRESLTAAIAEAGR